ncbi:O-antigen ligase family protein [Flavobacteriaceae bacterium]|nr:O-antigen ligase family protein [Flavobacteriaceae bacterium]
MKRYVGVVFISLYLITSILPGFGSIDRIGFHWLYLSVVSFFSLIFISFDENSGNFFQEFFNMIPVKLFIVFILFCLISFFYTINIQESILVLSRFLLLLLLLLNLYYHLKNLKHLNIVFIILLILFVYESLLPLIKFVEIYQNVGEYNFSYANDLKTFSPNKNITAVIIALNMGLMFYLFRFRRKIVQSILILFILIGSIDIVLISARASILSIFLAFFLLIISHYYFKIKLKKTFFNFFLATFFGFVAINIYLGQNNNVSLNNRLTTLNTEDESTNQRIRFYKHGLNHVIENPFFGVGLGNWKLKSIEYDKENIKSYVVPYHLHNDFLQLGTEIGILGLLSYLSLFFYLIIINFLNINKNYYLSIALLISSIVIFIDSNLNFPHHRPSVMVIFILLICLTELNKNKVFKNE